MRLRRWLLTTALAFGGLALAAEMGLTVAVGQVPGGFGGGKGSFSPPRPAAAPGRPGAAAGGMIAGFPAAAPVRPGTAGGMLGGFPAAPAGFSGAGTMIPQSGMNGIPTPSAGPSMGGSPGVSGGGGFVGSGGSPFAGGAIAFGGMGGGATPPAPINIGAGGMGGGAIPPGAFNIAGAGFGRPQGGGINPNLAGLMGGGMGAVPFFPAFAIAGWGAARPNPSPAVNTNTGNVRPPATSEQECVVAVASDAKVTRLRQMGGGGLNYVPAPFTDVAVGQSLTVTLHTKGADGKERGQDVTGTVMSVDPAQMQVILKVMTRAGQEGPGGADQVATSVKIRSQAR